MREQFWNFWMEAYYRERYFHHYQNFARIANGILTLLCSVAAIISLINFSLWGAIPLALGVLTALSQFVQAANPLFPFSKQLVSLRFLLPELSTLLLKVEHEWHGIDVLSYDDTKIRKLLDNFKESLKNMEHRYIGNAWFPVLKKIASKAENERNIFAEFKIKRSE